MASQIDFAIALGIFFVFMGVLIIFMLNYISSYTAVVGTSELSTTAYSIYNSLFSGKGVPADWEDKEYTPLKIGLISDLYSAPIKISETSGSTLSNDTINITVSLDSNCQNRSWETTLRLYDENNIEVPIDFYNITYCAGADRYMNSADMVLNLSLAAYQTKAFYLYFSPDQSIGDAGHIIPFPSALETISTIQLPETRIDAVSNIKLSALRNMTYEEVIKTLGVGYNFRVEISE